MNVMSLNDHDANSRFRCLVVVVAGVINIGIDSCAKCRKANVFKLPKLRELMYNSTIMETRRISIPPMTEIEPFAT
jgi:hypothetical protein